MRAVRLLTFITLCASIAGAQHTDSASTTTGRGSISGVVIDSVADRPLTGATVQLIVFDQATMFTRTTLSDSLGRYTIDRLPDGHYVLGFVHPMLDSLGLESPAREVFIRGAVPQRVDLAIPSPERLRWAVCGGPNPTQPQAMVVGFARDARDGSLAAGVTIAGEWNELTFTSSGITRSAPRLVAVTADNGWFALCGVPSSGLITLTANRGGDSSGVVEVQIPPTGFLRRAMYIASAPIVGGAAVGLQGNAGNAPRPQRRGHVRLEGTVRRLATGEPIAGAQVSIAEGPMTLTDEQGRWMLSNAPPGTRMLEVRAVGLYPERVPVDVVTGAAPVAVAMKTFQAVLETINVRAGRLVDHRTFEGRRRIGGGRFIQGSEIERFRVENLSEILRMQPGVRLERDSLGAPQLYLRGVDGIDCLPDLYIDGIHVFMTTAGDLDQFVRPGRVRGIEIYAASTAPPQFMRAHGGCGSIVIWTK
ncbi:MAG: carboxypeptidase regulatory-like domain-containing protein [Gemmatimonadaceae bacterium]